MGFNSVAVIFNDHLHDIKNSSTFGSDVYYAVREVDLNPNNRDLKGYFGSGMIISSAHADFDQLVVVGQNRGRLLRDEKNPSPVLINQLVDYLKDQGYSVRKNKK